MAGRRTLAPIVDPRTDPEQEKINREHENRKSALSIDKLSLANKNLELKNRQLELELQQANADREASRRHAKDIFTAFIFLNVGVFSFICLAWLAERLGNPPTKPLITERVVLALIAGSTTQLGALALGIGKRIWR